MIYNNYSYVLVFTILSCCFAGFGAVCRFALTKGISSIIKSKVPVATLSINCFASFVLGVAFNVFSVFYSIYFSNFVFVMFVGFLGGFSTFSTAIFEGVDLIQNKKIKDGVFLLSYELIMPFAAASIGYFFSMFVLINIV